MNNLEDIRYALSLESPYLERWLIRHPDELSRVLTQARAKYSGTAFVAKLEELIDETKKGSFPKEKDPSQTGR